MKYYIVKRDDAKFNGDTVDIPETSIQATLRNHPTWKIVEEVPDVVQDAQIAETPKLPEFACPICGKEFKNEKGLTVHKRSHK